MRGLLISLMVLGAMSSIGCSKKKKPSQQAMINACLFDPTGNCPRQAAAMAQAQFPGTLAYNVNPLLGPQNPVLVQNQNGSGGPIKVFSNNNRGGTVVTQSAVNNQQMRVQSALNADSRNPASLHYDPDIPWVPRQSQADIDAARALPTQNDQVGLPRNRPPGNIADGGAIQ